METEYLFQYANRRDCAEIAAVTGNRRSRREWQRLVRKPRRKAVTICAWKRGLEGLVHAVRCGDHLHLEVLSTADENPALAQKLVSILSSKLPVISLVPEENLDAQIQLRELGFEAVLPLIATPNGNLIEFWHGV